MYEVSRPDIAPKPSARCELGSGADCRVKVSVRTVSPRSTGGGESQMYKCTGQGRSSQKGASVIQ